MIKRKARNKPEYRNSPEKPRNRKYWTHIGLVSWGVECETPGIPGVYTNVQHYLKWILDNL